MKKNQIKCLAIVNLQIPIWVYVNFTIYVYILYNTVLYRNNTHRLSLWSFLIMAVLQLSLQNVQPNLNKQNLQIIIFKNESI